MDRGGVAGCVDDYFGPQRHEGPEGGEVTVGAERYRVQPSGLGGLDPPNREIGAQHLGAGCLE